MPSRDPTKITRQDVVALDELIQIYDEGINHYTFRERRMKRLKRMGLVKMIGRIYPKHDDKKQYHKAVYAPTKRGRKTYEEYADKFRKPVA